MLANDFFYIVVYKSVMENCVNKLLEASDFSTKLKTNNKFAGHIYNALGTSKR